MAAAAAREKEKKTKFRLSSFLPLSRKDSKINHESTKQTTTSSSSMPAEGTVILARKHPSTGDLVSADHYNSTTFEQLPSPQSTRKIPANVVYNTMPNTPPSKPERKKKPAPQATSRDRTQSMTFTAGEMTSPDIDFRSMTPSKLEQRYSIDENYPSLHSTLTSTSSQGEMSIKTDDVVAAPARRTKRPAPRPPTVEASVQNVNLQDAQSAVSVSLLPTDDIDVKVASRWDKPCRFEAPPPPTTPPPVGVDLATQVYVTKRNSLTSDCSSVEESSSLLSENDDITDKVSQVSDHASVAAYAQSVVSEMTGLTDHMPVAASDVIIKRPITSVQSNEIQDVTKLYVSTETSQQLSISQDTADCEEIKARESGDLLRTEFTTSNSNEVNNISRTTVTGWYTSRAEPEGASSEEVVHDSTNVLASVGRATTHKQSLDGDSDDHELTVDFDDDVAENNPSQPRRQVVSQTTSSGITVVHIKTQPRHFKSDDGIKNMNDKKLGEHNVSIENSDDDETQIVLPLPKRKKVHPDVDDDKLVNDEKATNLTSSNCVRIELVQTTEAKPQVDDPRRRGNKIYVRSTDDSVTFKSLSNTGASDNLQSSDKPSIIPADSSQDQRSITSLRQLRLANQSQKMPVAQDYDTCNNNNAEPFMTEFECVFPNPLRINNGVHDDNQNERDDKMRNDVKSNNINSSSFDSRTSFEAVGPQLISSDTDDREIELPLPKRMPNSSTLSGTGEQLHQIDDSYEHLTPKCDVTVTSHFYDDDASTGTHIIKSADDSFNDVIQQQVESFLDAFDLRKHNYVESSNDEMSEDDSSINGVTASDAEDAELDTMTDTERFYFDMRVHSSSPNLRKLALLQETARKTVNGSRSPDNNSKHVNDDSDEVSAAEADDEHLSSESVLNAEADQTNLTASVINKKLIPVDRELIVDISGLKTHTVSSNSGDLSQIPPTKDSRYQQALNKTLQKISVDQPAIIHDIDTKESATESHATQQKIPELSVDTQVDHDVGRTISQNSAIPTASTAEHPSHSVTTVDVLIDSFSTALTPSAMTGDTENPATTSLSVGSSATAVEADVNLKSSDAATDKTCSDQLVKSVVDPTDMQTKTIQIQIISDQIKTAEELRPVKLTVETTLSSTTVSATPAASHKTLPTSTTRAPAVTTNDTRHRRSGLQFVKHPKEVIVVERSSVSNSASVEVGVRVRNSDVLKSSSTSSAVASAPLSSVAVSSTQLTRRSTEPAKLLTRAATTDNSGDEEFSAMLIKKRANLRSNNKPGSVSTRFTANGSGVTVQRVSFE